MAKKSKAAVAPAEPEQELRIEYMALGALQTAPRNPKKHDLETAQASLNRFGHVTPLVLDERTGRLVAGHGRKEAYEGLKAAGKPPPGRVRVGPDGEWLVPVLRGAAFKDDKEAEAYLLVDNRLGEIGGWDEAALVESMRELDRADLLGWSDTEMAALQERVGTTEFLDGVIAEAGGLGETGAAPRVGGEHVTLSFTLTPEQNLRAYQALQTLKRAGARTNVEAFMVMCQNAVAEAPTSENTSQPVTG